LSTLCTVVERAETWCLGVLDDLIAMDDGRRRTGDVRGARCDLE